MSKVLLIFELELSAIVCHRFFISILIQFTANFCYVLALGNQQTSQLICLTVVFIQLGILMSASYAVHLESHSQKIDDTHLCLQTQSSFALFLGAARSPTHEFYCFHIPNLHL